MKENFKTTINTNVLIKDDLGNVLVDKSNAIHPQNMAIAIARGLSNGANHQIFKMKLGNQGTYIDSSQQIVFRPPNTQGLTADLYNPTYVEVVDDSDAAVGVGNSVTFTTLPAPSTSTRVIVTCVISANEAVNRPTDEDDLTSNDGLQGDGENSTALEANAEGEFFFDELGLFTQGIDSNLLNQSEELMLSHLIFSPIEHTGNRELTIVYTITVTVS